MSEEHRSPTSMSKPEITIKLTTYSVIEFSTFALTVRVLVSWVIALSRIIGIPRSIAASTFASVPFAIIVIHDESQEERVKRNKQEQIWPSHLPSYYNGSRTWYAPALLSIHPFNPNLL